MQLNRPSFAMDFYELKSTFRMLVRQILVSDEIVPTLDFLQSLI